MMHKITEATALENYRLDLVFDDSTRGIADLSHLVGKGVFSAWNDYCVFEKVTVGKFGESVWPGEIDLCPDSLYLQITGKRAEAIFPGLATKPAYA